MSREKPDSYHNEGLIYGFKCFFTGWRKPGIVDTPFSKERSNGRNNSGIQIFTNVFVKTGCFHYESQEISQAQAYRLVIGRTVKIGATFENIVGLPSLSGYLLEFQACFEVRF
jgi:hypothetical protein